MVKFKEGKLVERRGRKAMDLRLKGYDRQVAFSGIGDINTLMLLA
jgi:hypothetical protein